MLAYLTLQIYVRLTIGRCYCNVYLNGKTALITGGNSGKSDILRKEKVWKSTDLL